MPGKLGRLLPSPGSSGEKAALMLLTSGVHRPKEHPLRSGKARAFLRCNDRGIVLENSVATATGSSSD